MNYYIIGTTCINRPELHNDNMKEWMEWILELQKSSRNNKIKWIINIDYVEKLKTSYDDTKQNFEQIIQNRVDTTFLKNPTGKGNFLEACKRISQHIVDYVKSLNITKEQEENIKIIWLEDDWKLNQNTKIPIVDIIKNYSTRNSHINLSFIRNNYIWALAPSIISYNLWYNVHYMAWKSEEKPIDPEHCVGVYFTKHFQEPDSIYNVTIVNKCIKDFFLKEKYTSYTHSYYTYHSEQYKIMNNDKFIERDMLLEFLGDKMVFIRITASFCLDGVNYGRNFLERYNVIKAHSQDVNNFYN